ncbi:hypothetical protein FPQ18DRAFT_338748 [Pyronema domesticum]|nr:hypothetical protein FPQ18DRAFT_338748 [Pyronema domesticum]
MFFFICHRASKHAPTTREQKPPKRLNLVLHLVTILVLVVESRTINRLLIIIFLIVFRSTTVGMIAASNPAGFTLAPSRCKVHRFLAFGAGHYTSVIAFITPH